MEEWLDRCSGWFRGYICRWYEKRYNFGTFTRNVRRRGLEDFLLCCVFQVSSTMLAHLFALVMVWNRNSSKTLWKAPITSWSPLLFGPSQLFIVSSFLSIYPIQYETWSYVQSPQHNKVWSSTEYVLPLYTQVIRIRMDEHGWPCFILRMGCFWRLCPFGSWKIYSRIS